MDKHCIYCIFALETTNLFSYPKEIIMFIIFLMIDKIRVYFGHEYTVFIINNDVYTCGGGDGDLFLTKQVFDGERIDSICHGYDHTICVEKSKKEIYSWGENEYGQLGLGDKYDRDTPQKIMFDFKSRIIFISCGVDYTMAVTESGEIYGWGDNRWGQLGLGDKKKRNLPHKLSISDVILVSCGNSHTVVLTKIGCFGCGDNERGQLGLGYTKKQKLLCKINLSNPISICCGEDHTLALTNDGVYSWGYNKYGSIKNPLGFVRVSSKNPEGFSRTS